MLQRLEPRPEQRLETQANSVSKSDRHPRSLFCGWLPAIVIGTSKVWLPMASRSVTAITDAIVRQATQTVDVHLDASRQIADAMAVDTSFAIAATSLWVRDAQAKAVPFDSASGPTSISITQLANHWVANSTAAWRSTDWLACPGESKAATSWNRFTELDNYFQTLPISRWVEQSGIWFEAGGGEQSHSSILSKYQLVDDRQPETSAVQARSTDAHQVIRRIVDQFDASTVTTDSVSEAIQSAKRELAHTLAYGLSHEINNPLANIATRADALARNSEDSSQQESLRRIVDQTYRAHAMIADLMFYANPSQPHFQTFNVRERTELAIKSVADIAKRRSINVECVLDDAGMSLDHQGDPEMIGDVIVSLVQNSIDAIGIDGTIEVHLSSINNEDDTRAIQIRVCDSGPGITAEQAAKAFDPYFCDREAGRGLGLGLCRAQRIMELHNGDIELQPALAGCVATLRW